MSALMYKSLTWTSVIYPFIHIYEKKKKFPSQIAAEIASVNGPYTAVLSLWKCHSSLIIDEYNLLSTYTSDFPFNLVEKEG